MRILPDASQITPTDVSASSIAAQLLDADDPMDFIKNNLKSKAPEPQPQPQPQVTVQRPTEPTFAERLVNDVTPPQPAAHTQPAPTQPQQQTKQTPTNPSPDGEQPKDANALLEEVKKDKEASNREARKKINELNGSLAEREARLAELETQLEAFKSGEQIPETVQARLARMEQLEQYEELHNLRMSPKYQDNYVKPIEGLKQKAIQLAKDYEVDPAVLDDAMQIDNRRERNNFLKQHFDEIGALEVRNTLEEITRITDAAHEAEKAPGDTFQRLKREHELEQQAREAQRYEGLNRTAKQGWNEALAEIKREGAYPELVLTGDPKQDALVKPILQKAAESFGDFIKLFGVKKMEELPPEAARILSKHFLLSHATSVAIASRNDHFRRAEEVIESAHREAPFFRPQIGSSNVSPTVPSERASQKGKSLEDVAGDLINSVLRK